MTGVLPVANLATVGRRTEIDALQQVLGRVAAGQPHVVEIYGEPGIGKTRLLDELAEHARDRGMTLAFGRAGEYERNVPFGLIGDALEGLSSEGDVLFDAIATGRAAATERYRLYRS